MTSWMGAALADIIRRAFRSILQISRALIVVAGLVLLAGQTQGQPAGILGDGNAVATGFSGGLPPVQIAPGTDVADKTLIDGDGAVLRVIDIQVPGAPPAGQLLTAPKPFTVRASQIGQVFGVALDGANPPNIYAASTSLYGLPIVGSDIGTDGQPVRLKQGGPKAGFMQALFGPGGGPGSVWRIDGKSGAVSFFATVVLNGVANPGPALGGLAFDPVSNTLLVADRATGMIHRFDMNGNERNRFDHGTQGRTAGGLPALAYDPAQRLDITNPAFKPGDPATWHLAPPARRVFALTAQQGRLYYSVAEERQVWSIALAPDGTFGADARLELTVPAGPAPSEITRIVFDDRGRMLLAERMGPSGAYDFAALTTGGGGRVLRFEPSAGAAGQRWQPAAGDPEIGLDPGRRGNGGLAIGNAYDADGRRNPASCGGSLWWTGAQLSPGGANAVNGLSGRPEGATSAWLIDFDDQLDDPQSRGHMGDVTIFRACAPVVAGGVPPGGPPPVGAPPPVEPPFMTEAMPPEGGGLEDIFIPVLDWPLLPPPICPVGTHIEQGALTCCPLGMVPGETGACRSHCANGSMNAPDVFACDHGFLPNNPPGGPNVGTCWNGQPAQHLFPGGNNFVNNKCPKPPIGECQAGYQLVYASAANPVGPFWLWSNATCVQTPAQAGCVGNQQVGLDGVCHAICPAGQRAFQVNKCCANGTQPNALGQCGPGFVVPPLWYLDYLVTGSGPCIPPNCSFYEFTVTGRQRFGSGTLTQHITLPPGSAFSTARIVRGSRYCPTKAWSCSKSGHAVTCSAEHCGLGDGDQVVIRLEGSVAPGLTVPPPAPIEKTACGVLEWQAAAGPGAAVIQQPGANVPTPQPAQQGTAAAVSTPSKQACWTIRIVGQQPPTTTACPDNYGPTADGHCCLDRQLTVTGQCCLPGTRPDAARQTCVPVTPPPAGCTPAQMLANGQCCPSGTSPNNRRTTCDPLTPPPTGCERSQMTAAGQCCPEGTRPDATRQTCVPVSPPCEPSQRLSNGQCCPSGTWPNNRRMVCEPLTPPPTPPTRTCGPDQTGIWPNCCPQGRYWDGRQCVPVSTRSCPPDSIGTPPDCRCRPPLIGAPGSCTRPVVVCPTGMIGTPPNCHPMRPVGCPPGMIGTPPNCRPIRPVGCPPGMIGTPPNCRPIRPEGCPSGMIGSPPNCRPLQRETPMQRDELNRREQPFDRGAPLRRGGPELQ